MKQVFFWTGSFPKSGLFSLKKFFFFCLWLVRVSAWEFPVPSIVPPALLNTTPNESGIKLFISIFFLLRGNILSVRSSWDTIKSGISVVIEFHKQLLSVQTHGKLILIRLSGLFDCSFKTLKSEEFSLRSGSRQSVRSD